MKELKTILSEKQFTDKLNKILKNGGVIAFVTDTVWGLGCLPNSEKGADKIYEIKGRDRSKPLILMSGEKENLFPFVNGVPDKAQKLMDGFFPGALTLVLEKSDKTPDYITSNKNTVGIRVPNNVFFKKLCKCIEGGVLATTSANLSNQPSSKTYEEAKISVGSLVDFVFEDYGYKSKGLESTVAMVKGEDIIVLRQGAVEIPLI